MIFGPLGNKKKQNWGNIAAHLAFRFSRENLLANSGLQTQRKIKIFFFLKSLILDHLLIKYTETVFQFPPTFEGNVWPLGWLMLHR